MNGNNGNPFSRFGDLVKRDWQNFNQQDKQNYTDIGELFVNTAGTARMLPIKILNKGNFYIKGVGFVDNIVYYKTVKKLILNKVGISTFEKIVGRNPDIFVKDGNNLFERYLW